MLISIETSKALARAYKEGIEGKEGEEVSIAYSSKLGTYLVLIDKGFNGIDLIDPYSLEVIPYSRTGSLAPNSPID